MINHLWQSTLFAVVAGLLAAALRKNRAQVRYWIWFSASVKFFVPFALLISLGTHLQWAPSAHQIATPPAVTSTLEQFAQPFPEMTPPASRARSDRDWLPIVIVGGWAFGFLGAASIRLRGWLRIRAAVRASTPMDISAPVEIRAAPGLLEPGVVGVFRPILLLPEGIAQRLTPPQLEAVLAHELCHVRRRDNLFASIHMLVEAAFWFHPLVWWIGARLVEERERACDEAVLSLGSEPRVYAEAILNVCKLYVESPLVCVSGVTGSNLKKRIHAILTEHVAGDLTFARKLALAAAAVVAVTVPIGVGILNAPAIRAQSTSAPTPRFEVASIRLCESGGPPATPPAPSPGRLSVCAPVTALIQSAYVLFADGRLNLSAYLPVEGGPAWIKSDRYQVNAKAEGNPGQELMRGPMMQDLLEDRFELKIHRETREVPVYALTVAKGGPKLQPSKEGSCAPVDLTKAPAMPAEGQKLPNFCGMSTGGVKGPNWTGDFHRVSMTEFSQQLPFDRPVIDKTGLAGVFDFHLEYAAEDARGGAPADDPAGAPSIFTAIQEQLGLKLEPAKGPGEFLVIDSIEKPSEN